MAPKNKLLIYNVKEGWEPLCKFLDVPVPAKPFPHRNKKGAIMQEFMQTHPVFKRIQLEALFSLGCISIGLGYFGFKAVKYFMQK